MEDMKNSCAFKFTSTKFFKGFVAFALITTIAFNIGCKPDDGNTVTPSTTSSGTTTGTTSTTTSGNTTGTTSTTGSTTTGTTTSGSTTSGTTTTGTTTT